MVSYKRDLVAAKRETRTSDGERATVMAQVFGFQIGGALAASQAPLRRIEPRFPRGTRARIAIDYALLFIGALIVALAFNTLLRPNDVAPGGVVGVSLLLRVRFGVEPAFSQWGINLLLLTLCARLIKRDMLAKTVVGSLALPFWVWATRGLEPMTHQPLLAAIFGGLGIGLGAGLIFRGEASVGGFTLLAPLMQRRFGISVGTGFAILDGCVMLLAAFVLGAERALLGLVAVYLTRNAIDIVQSGLSYAKLAFIISEESDEIRRAIAHELQRGLTVVPARGGWTDHPRDVLMVVVGSTEVLRLQMLVRSIDPRAFVILSDTREVIGQGFRVGD